MPVGSTDSGLPPAPAQLPAVLQQPSPGFPHRNPLKAYTASRVTGNTRFVSGSKRHV